MSHMLLALLVLMIRLFTPAMPMAMTLDLQDPLAGVSVLCHITDDDPSTAPSPAKPVDHGSDCLLCPACHIVSHSVLLMLGGPFTPHLPGMLINQAALLPPATGPPRTVVRIATPPTGPPTRSI